MTFIIHACGFGVFRKSNKLISKLLFATTENLDIYWQSASISQKKNLFLTRYMSGFAKKIWQYVPI